MAELSEIVAFDKGGLLGLADKGSYKGSFKGSYKGSIGLLSRDLWEFL